MRGHPPAWACLGAAAAQEAVLRWEWRKQPFSLPTPGGKCCLGCPGWSHPTGCRMGEGLGSEGSQPSPVELTGSWPLGFRKGHLTGYSCSSIPEPGLGRG